MTRCKDCDPKWGRPTFALRLFGRTIFAGWDHRNPCPECGASRACCKSRSMAQAAEG